MIISMNNNQKQLFEMLVDFDKIAKNLNINYHLIAGSLIGAIRHSGFIPWDDDIDILMPIEDYNKLLNEFSNKKYFIQSINSDRSYFYLFAKFRLLQDSSQLTEEDKKYKRIYGGPWIDIFPCIKIPPIESIDFKKWKKKRIFLSKILSIKSIPFSSANLIKKCFKILFFIVPRKTIVKKINNTSVKFLTLNSCHFYAQDFWSSDNKQYLGNYSFDNSILVKFEGGYFPITKNYDEWLTRRYGDYMTPPPMSSRHNHFGN